MRQDHPIRTGLAKAQGVRFLAVFMALWLFGCTAFQFLPQTPYGVQCPTAPVQKVMVPVRTKCGCIVAYDVRAPKPGDKAFVQCRCAEKKGVEHSTAPPPKLEAFVTPPISLDLPGPLPAVFERPQYRATEANAVYPPEIPPPSLA